MKELARGEDDGGADGIGGRELLLRAPHPEAGRRGQGDPVAPRPALLEGGRHPDRQRVGGAGRHAQGGQRQVHQGRRIFDRSHFG